MDAKHPKESSPAPGSPGSEEAAPRVNPLKVVVRTLMMGLAHLIKGAVHAAGDAPQDIKSGFKEASAGLKSADRPTRRMSVVFYLSIVGILIALAGLTKNSMRKSAERKEAEMIAQKAIEDEKLKAEELKRSLEPPPYQSIGTFSVEIRETEGVTRSSGMRAAEMEVVLACSTLDVCNWIKSNLDLSRGELSSLFTPTDRDKIMSPAGKKALREEIRDAINHLLEARGVHGTVLEVLFPRFIVT